MTIIWFKDVEVAWQEDARFLLAVDAALLAVTAP